jgi:hypothetical protein
MRARVCMCGGVRDDTNHAVTLCDVFVFFQHTKILGNVRMVVSGEPSSVFQLSYKTWGQ